MVNSNSSNSEYWYYSRYYSDQCVAEYRKGASADAVFRAVAEQRSSRHRDSNDPRARQLEARMEVLAFEAMR